MQSLYLDRLTRKIRGKEFATVYTESLYNKLQVQESPEFPSRAHVGAVNSLSIEQVDYKYLLSGGADGSVKLWDVKDIKPAAKEEIPHYSCVGSISKGVGHNYGVSAIQWWPLDTGMFVSSSFDHTVKVWDTNELSEVFSFDMEQRVYSIDISPTGLESLVAVASDHPFLRLLDLRTTAATHTLYGHKGKILSVKWSPVNSNILASGGSDGEVKLWDIRRSNACVCRLDMYRTNTSYPIASTNNRTKAGSEGKTVKAHLGPVNGLLWVDNGSHIVSAGNDDKIRVWDLEPSGAINKLVNFGPLVRNKYPQSLSPCLSPANESELQYLLFPSDTGDIILYSVHDGKLISRLSRGSLAPRTCSIVYGGQSSARYFCGTGNGDIIVWSAEPGTIERLALSKAKSVLDNIHNEMEAHKILSSI